MTSFVPDEQRLYLDYEVISLEYRGWPLSEIRGMSSRQREYWLKMIKWKRERSRSV